MASITSRMLLVSLGTLLVASSCSSYKRIAYEGFGRDQWQQPEKVIASRRLEPGQGLSRSAQMMETRSHIVQALCNLGMVSGEQPPAHLQRRFIDGERFYSSTQRAKTCRHIVQADSELRVIRLVDSLTHFQHRLVLGKGLGKSTQCVQARGDVVQAHRYVRMVALE